MDERIVEWCGPRWRWPIKQEDLYDVVEDVMMTSRDPSVCVRDRLRAAEVLCRMVEHNAERNDAEGGLSGGGVTIQIVEHVDGGASASPQI